MGRKETRKMVRERALPGRRGYMYRGKVGRGNWKVFSTPELIGSRYDGGARRQP